MVEKLGDKRKIKEKIGGSYSPEVATTAHVTPFFLAVLGVTTALPFVYLTPRCHGILKTLTQ